MAKNPRMLVMAVALVLMASTASAGMYDLLTVGSDRADVTGGVGGTAVFNTIFTQPGGTGYIDPFIRTQLNGTVGSYCAGTVTGKCEQGYNTDGIEQYDTKEQGGSNWDHSILLGDIPIVTFEGKEYREFLLDINQSQGDTKYPLSLDELQFFITDNNAITDYNDTPNLFNNGAPNMADLVWQMDDYGVTPEDNWLLLDNCKYVTCGSGDLDLQALIPSEVFGTDDSKYVVLFNRFGDNAGATGANAGFEEWVYRTALHTTSVPEPGMLPLVFAGLLAGWMVRRRTAVLAA